MESKEPLFPPNLHKSWIFWASLLLVLIPLTRLLFLWAQPCATPPSYYAAYDDPVSYPQLIDGHTIKNCGLILELVIGTPVASLILLVASKGKRFIAIPAAVVACTSICMVTLEAFGGLYADGVTLTEKGSTDFNNRRYHLTEAQVIAGGVDVSYTMLILHECDLDDTDCYGREINEYGRPEFTNPSLVINQGLNQLEVWSEGEIVFTVSGSP